MKNKFKNIIIIFVILISVKVKSQTTIIPENPNAKPWTDSTALLIDKVGLNNIWEYTKILNISKADSLWFKPYKPIIFNTAFMNGLFLNVHNKPINDSIVIPSSDSNFTVYGKSYNQKRTMTIYWDAEGKFDNYHTNCVHRKITAIDRIKTVSLDSNAHCMFFTNKISYFHDKGCNDYKVAFVQAFMEDCAHTTSNYYKFLFTYDPNFNYNDNGQSLAAIINLNVNPNPSPGNGVTTITYNLPQAGNVILQIQNVVTQVTQEVFNGNKNAGSQSKNVNVNSLSTGTYYVKLIYQNQTFSKLLIVN